MVVLVRVIVEGLDAAGGGGEVLQAAERGTNEGNIKPMNIYIDKK